MSVHHLIPIPAGTAQAKPRRRVYVRGDVATRFWAHVEKGPGCWLWTGARTWSGHGTFNVGAKKFDRAHRVAYRLVHGAIPDGLVVCHQCDNPPCVNPAHLWLGTQGDNLRDMMAKGRAGGQFKPKTHCIRGHAFTPENSKPKRGGRACRTCERMQDRARRAVVRSAAR